MIEAYRSDPADLRRPEAWYTLKSGAKISALPVEQTHDRVRFARLGLGPAREWAASQGLRLATAAELAELPRAIEPYTLPTVAMLRAVGLEPGTAGAAQWQIAHMMGEDWCHLHDVEVTRRLRAAGVEADGNAGKHWYDDETGGGIVGWWYLKPLPNGRTQIQGASKAHRAEPTYTDYGSTFHVVDDGSVPPATKPKAPAGDPLAWPAVRTPIKAAELAAALERAWPDGPPRRESVLVLLAQSGIETGDWRACWNYNFGNVKRVPGEPYMMLPNVWEMIKGEKKVFQPPHPQTHFRAFASVDEGARAYLDALSKRFAKAWPAVLAGEPETFAHELKRLRYYTADEAAYAKALRARFEAFRAELDGGGIDLGTPAGIARALISLGFDASLGDMAMIRAFQGAHPPLKVDGIAGPKTQAAIAQALNDGAPR